MKTKRKLLASISLTAAATASLMFSGAFSATADPVAAPAGSSYEQPFVVPANTAAPGEDLRIFGNYSLWWLPLDDAGAYQVTMTCDGVSMAVNNYAQSPDRQSGWFVASIPAAEVGHTCVLNSTTPTDRKLAFTAVTYKATGDGSAELRTDVTAVNTSSAGAVHATTTSEVSFVAPTTPAFSGVIARTGAFTTADVNFSLRCDDGASIPVASSSHADPSLGKVITFQAGLPATLAGKRCVLITVVDRGGFPISFSAPQATTVNGIPAFSTQGSFATTYSKTGGL